MRTIQVEKITEEVAQMCKEAAYYLPKDVYEALKKGRETEESPVGRDVLDQIILFHAGGDVDEEASIDVNHADRTAKLTAVRIFVTADRSRGIRLGRVATCRGLRPVVNLAIANATSQFEAAELALVAQANIPEIIFTPEC